MRQQIKKIIAALMCLMIMLSMSSFAMAEETIKVTLNGNEITFDQPPIIENDRTLVPMRAIFEAMGARVEWEDAFQTVTGTKNDIVVKMQIGNNVITKNGQSITLDVPPKIVNDRTLVPVRAVAESFDAKVEWKDETQTVIITTEDKGGETDNPTAEPEYTPSPKPDPTPSVTPNTQIGGIKLNYEYGPFSITSYYSKDRYWDSIQVSSLIFSKVEKTSVGYKVTMNVKGKTDADTPCIKVKFYSASDMVLEESRFYIDVAVNEPFNTLKYTYIDYDVIENSVRIEFYSYTGEKAVYGIGSSETNPTPKPTTAPADESDGKKFSLQDVMDLNSYAKDATTNANQALSYATQALKNSGALRTVAVQQAKNSATKAKTSLTKALTLLNNRVELKLTGSDYNTAADLVQAAINDLDAIINKEVNSDTASVMEFGNLAVKGPIKCLAFQKLTVDLLAAFSS